MGVNYSFQRFVFCEYNSISVASSGSETLEISTGSKPDTFEILMDAIEGKDYNSISIDRNIPENTVKTRVFRARKFLQKYMEVKDLSLDMVSH